jgi:large subunit ribosomal protein L30
MIAVIRIRGSVKTRGDVEDTLKLMRLESVNHCVVLPENPNYRGMIQKTNDLITWGEIEKEVFKNMLMKWGRVGKKRLDEKYLKDRKYTADKLVDEVFAGKTKLQDIGINPLFRLHPPAKGYEKVKKPYSAKGALGYRGKEINELLNRMI